MLFLQEQTDRHAYIIDKAQFSLEPLHKLYQLLVIFMPYAWKSASSNRIVHLSIIPSRLHINCNIYSLGDDTVTKLGQFI